MAAPKDKDEAQTADGGAGAQDTSQAMQDAQAVTNATPDATPDATYSQGTPGVDVDFAIPQGVPIVSTYEDALEAGYFGYAPGHANTDKLSVSAVTERDRKLGLAGTGGLKGAVVNAPSDSATYAKKDAGK